MHVVQRTPNPPACPLRGRNRGAGTAAQRRTACLALAFAPLLAAAQAFCWVDGQVDSSATRMPVPLTNAAVTGYGSGTAFRAYLFGGIDSTLQASGIRRLAYRYDPPDAWTALPPVPDTLGKIGSAASAVGDRIYVLGGYHVRADGSEASSDRVHVFDPATDTWLPDGAPIPVPIDDHVQAVWRDSLIYVVTGWSNTTTVANVQIYDPATDTWRAGTPVPNTSQYKAFGASGHVAGDTLYYYGGARFGIDFPLGGFARKGVIDPADPTRIDWSVRVDPQANRYRAAVFLEPACTDDAGTGVLLPVVAGGSRISYNYDGLAYAGGAPVDPEPSLLLDEGKGPLLVEGGWPVDLMDLRGVAERLPPVAGSVRYFLGGMRPGRRVWGRALFLTVRPTGLSVPPAGTLAVAPTVTDARFRVLGSGDAMAGPVDLLVLDAYGRPVLRRRATLPVVLDLGAEPAGVYHVLAVRDGRPWRARVVVAP